MSDVLSDYQHKASLIDGTNHAAQTRVALLSALTPEQAREVRIRPDGIPVWHHVELGQSVHCEACDTTYPWTPTEGWERVESEWFCRECARPDTEGADRFRRFLASASLSAAAHQLMRVSAWLEDSPDAPHALAGTTARLCAERDKLLSANGIDPESWRRGDTAVRDRLRREITPDPIDTQTV